MFVGKSTHTLKFLTFKVCSLNPTVETLHILNFIIIIICFTQVVNFFSKIRQNYKII
jgi:hypothetical protein